MKNYDSYKETGIDLIGKIPNHWEVRRIANLGKFTKGKGISRDEILPTGIPCIRYGEIYTDYERIVYLPKSFISKESSQRSEVIKKGDVLFTGSGETVEDIGKSVVYYGEDDIYAGGDIIILKLNDGFSPLFISYLMNCNFVNQQKANGGRGEIIVHIYPKQIREIFVSIPPLAEQSIIATFLDYKTQQIDELITKKQRLIELLKEERTALINHAVTKGLDPNVPMKDSEIEWLGEIPEYWEVSKIKYCAEINNDVLGDSTPEDFEFKYVDIGIITFGKLNGLPEKLLFKNSPSRARRILYEGDTIISTVRTYLKAILFIDNSLNGFVGSTGFAVLTPTKKFMPKFLFYMMTSQQIVEQICSISVGVSYPATNASDIGNISIWLPPISEQDKIVNFIEGRINYLTNIEERSLKEIELISEYKASLINETVTGKIDVRKYSIQNNHEERI